MLFIYKLLSMAIVVAGLCRLDMWCVMLCSRFKTSQVYFYTSKPWKPRIKLHLSQSLIYYLLSMYDSIEIWLARPENKDVQMIKIMFRTFPQSSCCRKDFDILYSLLGIVKIICMVYLWSFYWLLSAVMYIVTSNI